jgi:hypothetical protein
MGMPSPYSNRNKEENGMAGGYNACLDNSKLYDMRMIILIICKYANIKV